MTEVVETAGPSEYYNVVQEQPPQLTCAWDHANGDPARHPFHENIFMGPVTPAPRYMVNGPSNNPPNGLPRVNFSDAMRPARSKLTLLHSFRA